MEKVIKQSVGIDCAQNELVASFGVMDECLECRIISNKTFRNDQSGFKALLSWSRKLRQQKETPLSFVVEATGVYHESMAVYVHEQRETISVVLANKVKHFAGTLKSKTVTDKVSAKTIALMGLEKKLEAWQPPHPVYNQLRQLTRERDQLTMECTQIKNQVHAEQAGAWPNKESIARMNQRMNLIKKQQEDILTEIKEQLKQHLWLQEKIEKLCSIKGVGLMTAIIAVAETNGFNLVRNKKQLVSYAGLDVKEKQSGTSVHGKKRISRKGNKYLRKAMHFPALTAIRSNEKTKFFFERLVSKHNIKMKAVVAVQRKMLELLYVLWKKNEYYDPDFEIKKIKKLEQLNKAALTELA